MHTNPLQVCGSLACVHVLTLAVNDHDTNYHTVHTPVHCNLCSKVMIGH